MKKRVVFRGPAAMLGVILWGLLGILAYMVWFIK